MMQTNTFLRYFDLKYGAILIGTCYLLGEILSILALVLWYINSEDNAYTNFSQTPLKVTNNPCILILPVFCCICGVVITILMVYGSLMNKVKLIVPFLVINSIAIVFGFIISWAYIIFTFMEEGAKGCVWLFVLNGSIVLSIYFWIVVYNRLEEVILENEIYGKKIPDNTNPKHPEQNLHSWAIKKNSTQIEPDDPYSLLEPPESSEEPFRRSTKKSQQFVV